MGSIRERRPGTFELRAYVGRSPTGSPIFAQETYVHPRKDGGIQEATRRLRALEAKHQEQRSSHTFGALLDAWLAHSEAIGRSPTTLHGYKAKAKRIREALGSIDLSKLSAHDLDRWYGQLRSAGTSPAMVRHYHRIISAVLAQGERWDLVVRNTAKRARPGTVPKPTLSTPTIEQVRKVVAAAEISKAPGMADLILVAALTGMRRGELCGLRWHDVDWDNRTIQVRRAVYEAGSDIGEKDPKTHQARTIQVSAQALGALRRRLSEAQADATVAGYSIDRNGFIWSGDLLGRTPMTPDRITQAFRRLADKAGFDFRFHDLRHFVGTELIDRGHDPVTVSKQLGHASVSTTMNLYAHGREPSARAAADELGTLFG
jgi:integrase